MVFPTSYTYLSAPATLTLVQQQCICLKGQGNHHLITLLITYSLSHGTWASYRSQICTSQVHSTPSWLFYIIQSQAIRCFCSFVTNNFFSNQQHQQSTDFLFTSYLSTITCITWILQFEVLDESFKMHKICNLYLLIHFTT